MARVMKSWSATTVYRLLQLGSLLWSGAVFLLIVILPIGTDLQLHAKMVSTMIAECVLPGNPLYFVLVAALSGFSRDLQVLCYSSCAILAFSVLIKYTVTKNIVFTELAQNGLDERNPRFHERVVGLLVILFCLSLFAHNYPVFSRWLYLGQFPPNVWHNSTTIFVMPFALLLFYKSYCFLRDGGNRLLPSVLVLCIVNILIKPSYCFVFLLVFPIFAVSRFGISKKSLAAIGVACVVGAAVVLQYLYIYKYLTARGVFAGLDRTEVRISFLTVWRQYSQNVLLSLLASLVFPLVSLAVSYKTLISSLLYRYAAGSFIVALAIYVLLTETGYRQWHGNFSWQVIITNYMLFLAAITEIARRQLVSPLSARQFKIVSLALLGHYAFGLVYLAKILVFGSYK